ncbi:HlyD family secretion protein [Spiribacter sp. SSL99]|uniref:HlyD family secretion protein n=1 Tax=Spiribacter sp. SSL99 TaxID=1866884 RepID=UPI00132FA160|nr:biotin/lipoyl-binding protein [Spiribacter sp. SSL99]
MQRLRRPPRVDRLQTEQRRHRARIGRWVYLLLLLGLVVWLLNIFFGDRVYLSAPGMVTRDQVAVSVSYSGRVTALHVREGDRVEAGQRLATLESLPVQRDIANLSAQWAEWRRRRAALAAERYTIRRMLPVAREQASTIAELLGLREKAYEEGLSTHLTLHELVTADYRSTLQATELEAREQGIAREIDTLDDIVTRFERSLDGVRARFDGGEVYARHDGIITDVHVKAGGHTGQPGDLMTMVVGEPYVLAYIPPGALYSVSEGDRVRVSYGFERLDGIVESIRPVSVRLPEEFQRAFQPRQRSQIVRVNLTNGEIPPAFTAVQVSASGGWWSRGGSNP